MYASNAVLWTIPGNHGILAYRLHRLHRGGGMDMKHKLIHFALFVVAITALLVLSGCKGGT